MCCSGVSFWSRKKMTPCSVKAACTSSHWRLLIALTSTPKTSAPQPPVSLRTCTVSYAMTLPPGWGLPSLHAEEQQDHRQSEDACARRNDDRVGREPDACAVELGHQVDVGAGRQGGVQGRHGEPQRIESEEKAPRRPDHQRHDGKLH